MEVSVVLAVLYKPTSQAPTSEEMENYCSKAAPQTLCKESVKKTLSSLDNQAAIMGLRLDATLVGSTKALSAALTVGSKIESSTVKDILRMVANVEFKTPVSPVYEVKLISSNEIPRVNILLNKEQLLQQALQVVLNGHVSFGYATHAKEIIRMKSLLIKSEQQKESVRPSPEFLRCTQEERLERPLTAVCELVRHQAASVDEVHTELVIASYLRESPIYDLIVPNIANVLKAVFIGHVIETPINNVSPTDLKIITKVNRIGTMAQMVIEYNGRRYEVRNLRIPSAMF